MRPIASVLIPVTFLAAMTLCAGCGADQHARIVVEPNTMPGRVEESLKGTGSQMVSFGRIDAHREIEAPDGTEIDTWVLLAKPAADAAEAGPRGTVIVLHGLTESKGSFPYLGAAQVLARKGYDVVLPDLRAHGRSGGKFVTYGAKEKHDVKAVVDTLLADETIHEPLYAFGATLGGSTAIQYAVIDPRCKAVMAITPYQDFPAIARRQLLALTDDQFRAAIARSQELANFDAADASTVLAAQQLTVPLLLVHGMIDLRVPPEQSQIIYDAAAGPKQLLQITPGPEQVAIFTVMEDWVADKMDELIQNPPGSEPAEQE